jgi:hypothetical protein
LLLVAAAVVTINILVQAGAVGQAGFLREQGMQLCPVLLIQLLLVAAGQSMALGKLLFLMSFLLLAGVEAALLVEVRGLLAVPVAVPVVGGATVLFLMGELAIHQLLLLAKETVGVKHLNMLVPVAVALVAPGFGITTLVYQPQVAPV